MKNTKFHGLTSLTFASIAIILAAIAVFQAAVWMGIGYLLVCVVASTVVIYGYCAKCPCKAHCGHIFPGKAAMLFKRKTGPYSKTEINALQISLLLLVGLPQLALWSHPGMLIAFWVLIGIAGTQALSMVCRACGNINCPLNKARQIT